MKIKRDIDPEILEILRKESKSWTEDSEYIFIDERFFIYHPKKIGCPSAICRSCQEEIHYAFTEAHKCGPLLAFKKILGETPQ